MSLMKQPGKAKRIIIGLITSESLSGYDCLGRLAGLMSSGDRHDGSGLLTDNAVRV